MKTYQPFSLLIKPTQSDCNLRCAYCFYLDKCALYPDSARHRMTDETLETLIRSYMATRQPSYTFGWQGGEPTLMGLEFFQKVTALQQRYGRAGVSVANGLQTNGTLITPELARHLAAFHFLVGVSLDGPKRVHDQYRVTVDGRGSHGQVMRGIQHLREAGAEFNILTLVSQSNVRRSREVYQYLCDKGFLFHQYIECVEYDADGNLAPFAITGEQWGAFMCGIYDQWIRGDTRRVSIRLFDSIVNYLVTGVPNVCKMCRDCRQYLLVEHNGDVYPCDFFVEKDLLLGNVATHAWSTMLDSPVYEAFGRRKANWCEACETCPWLEWCMGDCPKNRRGGVGDGRQLSELCAGWKLFYAHTADGFRRLAAEVRGERIAGLPPPPR